MSAGPGAICIWWDELDDSPPHLQDVSEFEILRAFPNPFNSTVAFDLKGQIHTSAELRIFDLCGRQVAELPLAVGQNRVFWDAHDGAGQEVAAGAYFVSLKGENERTAKKILYLK